MASLSGIYQAFSAALCAPIIASEETDRVSTLTTAARGLLEGALRVAGQEQPFAGDLEGLVDGNPHALHRPVAFAHLAIGLRAPDLNPHVSPSREASSRGAAASRKKGGEKRIGIYGPRRPTPRAPRPAATLRAGRMGRQDASERLPDVPASRFAPLLP